MNDVNRPQKLPLSSSITVLLCASVAVFEGFDLQAAGVAASRVAPALKLDAHDLGSFFSASTFGLMLGSVIGGRLSDRLGRKAILIASVGLFGILSIATGLANDLTGLLTARFLTGVGLGGALPNLIALVAENTPPHRRGAAVGILYAGMPSGGALVSLVSLLGAGSSDWRQIFYIGGIAPLLAVVPLMLVLPKPVPVIRHGEAEKAGFAAAVFGEGRAGTSMLLWVGFFLALLAMYLLLNWLPLLLIGRGLSRADSSIVQMAFNLFGAAGSVVVGRLTDNPRRRPVVIVAVFSAAAVALVTVATAPVSLAISFWVGAALGATISGTQTIFYGLAPTLYPTAVRGTGVGVSVSVGRLGSAAGPLLAAALISAGSSSAQVLMALLPVVALAALAAVWLSTRRANMEARLLNAAAK